MGKYTLQPGLVGTNATRLIFATAIILLSAFFSISHAEEIEDDDQSSKPAQHQIGMWPTADGLKQGEASIRGYVLPSTFPVGMMDAQVGITDWLEFDGYIGVPSYYYEPLFMTGGMVRFHFPTEKGTKVSIGLTGGYIDDNPAKSRLHRWLLGYFGAIFNATMIEKKQVVDFMISAHALHSTDCSSDRCKNGGSLDRSFAPAILTSSAFGYRYKIDKSFTFYLRLVGSAIWSTYNNHDPLIPVNPFTIFFATLTITTNYGVRWEAGHFFGDLGIYWPLAAWYYAEPSLRKYFPLGVPFVSIGVRF